jgi:hypothetical protein
MPLNLPVPLVNLVHAIERAGCRKLSRIAGKDLIAICIPQAQLPWPVPAPFRANALIAPSSSGTAWFWIAALFCANNPK